MTEQNHNGIEFSCLLQTADFLTSECVQVLTSQACHNRLNASTILSALVLAHCEPSWFFWSFWTLLCLQLCLIEPFLRKNNLRDSAQGTCTFWRYLYSFWVIKAQGCLLFLGYPNNDIMVHVRAGEIVFVTELPWVLSQGRPFCRYILPQEAGLTPCSLLQHINVSWNKMIWSKRFSSLRLAKTLIYCCLL